MPSIQDYIPVTKAKSELLNLIRKLEDSDDAIAITKNGVPEVVMISLRKFNGLMETIEILSDEETMKAIRTSIRQANRGEWLDYDAVFEK